MRHTREVYETELYQGWSFPLLPSTSMETTSYHLRQPSYREAAQSRLGLIQHELKKLVEYEQTISVKYPLIEKPRIIEDEVEHQQLIGELQSRIIPVDIAMRSDIFSVSFYRQEFVPQEQEIDEEAKEKVVKELKFDEKSNYNQSEEEVKVDDNEKEGSPPSLFGPRMEVFQVYSLTDS